MKRLTLYLILLIVRVGAAQEQVSLSGRVVSRSSGEALPYATIRLDGTSIGTTSNQSGEFVFSIPTTYSGRVVSVSYLGYQSVRINPDTIDQKRLHIALDPVAVDLGEVTVRPIDPWALVEQSIKKLPHNYSSSPYVAEGFQREYVTSNQKVIQLLEVAFRSKGSAASQTTQVLDARYLEAKREKAPLWNPSRGGFYTFGWTSVSGIEVPGQGSFLGITLKKSSDLRRYYEFTYRNTISQDGREVYVLDFDQKKQIRKALLKGTLYIDVESGAIVRMEHELSPRGVRFLKPHQTWGELTISKPPKRITVQQDRWVTTYRQYGQKWYLNSVVIDTDFTAALVILGMVQAQQSSLRLHSERIVTAIDTLSTTQETLAASMADVGSIPTLQNFIKKQYERYDEPGTENWTRSNIIPSDTATAHLAEQLSLNNQQWEQELRLRANKNGMNSGPFTTQQLTSDIDYLQESLVKLHPGLTWYTDKASLDSSFSSVRSKLAGVTSESDFFQLLSPIIEQLHCGHTELLPSSTAAENKASSANIYPLDLWFSGDSAMVSSEYEGIPAGSQVMSINNLDVAEVIRRITSSIPSDGFNQTYKWFRLQTEFPVLYERYIQRTDQFEVRIKEGSGQIRTLRLDGKPRGNEVHPAELATAQIIDSLQTLVLRIPSFSTQQDFPAFLKETFRVIASKGIKNLVIDLRNNQGGSDEYGALLFAYLTGEPFRYYDRISVATEDSSLLNRLSVSDLPLLKVLPRYTSHIQQSDGVLTYSDHANLAIQQSQPHAFRGKVYILINGGTFSTAAEFTAIARSNKRAVFIGQETGGGYYGNSSLATPLLTLPNSKIRLAVPLAKYELAVSHDVPVGHGTIPDYTTTYSSEDIVSNRDRDMEVCLELIRKSN
ncbi:S41 family peptidase [Telluribacter sp. SYSU D00476]|uniref:S41 family peptidase n=1 Tax=Telluribacter sp. SYSU D00476 TaxID=2811430 RepID=UPI001FF5FDC0|nr:S41 family peptidase [Telluribacter sp. SYSU D00476]